MLMKKEVKTTTKNYLLKRAEVIKQLLVDRGINASQLSFEGKGEDKTVNANSSNARQLARRVTFELK